MRNYIILNDVNSNTINGLLIQELPPISKPKMRTQIEEIDGRAGDIVTQLGYAAYTKTISIGLYGDFDIDEVISYFNSTGKVVFSNEPDKYYNYEIIDQIDFNRLVRFRTAKVKMHVQPFKYPTEEEPLVAQYQLVTNTGSDMSLNNTANALFRKLDLKGNTSQTGTPTPDAPVDVDVVSGDNVLSICGKNLFSSELEIGAINNNTGLPTSENNAVRTKDFIRVSPNTEYIVTNDKNYACYTYEYDKDFNFIRAYSGQAYYTECNFTTSPNTYYIKVRSIASLTQNDITTKYNLNKGSTALPYEPYIGQDYPIYLGVENLFDGTFIQGGVDFGSTGADTSSTNRIRSGFIQVLPNTTYTISSNNTNLEKCGIGLYKSDNSYDISHKINAGGWNDFPTSFTTQSDTKYIKIAFRKNDNSDITPTGDYEIQLELGSKANHYTPYGTTPIELCGIGDYEDKPFKAVDGDKTYDSLTDAQKEGLTIGNWYVYKAIGKKIFDGTEDGWSIAGSSGHSLYAYSSLTNFVYVGNLPQLAYCNQFVSANVGSSNDVLGFFMVSNGVLRFREQTMKTLADWKTWLGNNNLLFYYVYETPTITEITDEDLIEQLEALKQANSYDGQTNISHEYNGSPFILDVAAVQKGTDTLVVNNEGNIYARPTLDIEGTGMVNVYLEGNQMFQVDLSENNEIVIDTDEMEAYDPSTQALMNRQVTGNYDNFKIVAGNNNLKFSGDLTKATVTNYERWL